MAIESAAKDEFRVLGRHQLGNTKLQRALFLILLLSWLCASSGLALDPSRSLSQFDHTAWTARSGAPSHIAALAQTTDGFLWLGTTQGLYRFDGVTFEAYKTPRGPALPAKDISSLLADPKGGLWIGYRMGDIAFLKNGTVVDYPTGTGTIFSMALQRDGTLWVAAYELLRILPNGKVDAIKHRLHFGGTVAYRVFVDSGDNLWVGTDLKIHLKRAGSGEFEDTNLRADGNADFSQAPDGSLWRIDTKGVVQIPREPAAIAATSAEAYPHYLLSSPNPEGLLVDRDGTVWCFVRSQGILRYSYPLQTLNQQTQDRALQPQHFDKPEGLSGSIVTASLQDREGNIWVATSNGLDRFRMTVLAVAPLEKYAGELGIAADSGTSMIVSTRGSGLLRMQGEDVRKIPIPLIDPITCIYRAPDGKLWIGGYAQLGYLQRGRYMKIALPKEFEWVPRETQSMAATANGDLFLSTIGRNLYRVRDGVFTEIKLKGVVVPLSLLVDRRDRIWVGYMKNQIRVLDGDSVISLDERQGVTVGHVHIIYEGKSGIWIAGEHGLNLLQRDHFVSVTFANAFLPTGVTGIVEGDDGSLWLNAVEGVARISPEELRAFLADHSHVIGFTLYGSLDGIAGEAPTFRPLPSALRGSDGRLWFTSDAGISSVDPREIYRNTVVPPVSIKTVITASQSYPETSRVVLAKGNPAVEIDYSAQSLSVPERVFFRYRLEGVDRTWQDVGTRRQAFYTGIPPGEHRFQVIASNGDGVWNNEGASIVLIQPPTFIQTVWFKVLCCVAALALVSLVFFLRMRQMVERLQLRMAERLVERERIARDLHDTLLQGFQGILLRFQVIAQRLSPDDPARPQMEDTARRADGILSEARDKVWQLRTQSAKGTDLAAYLTEAADQFSGRQGADLEIVVTGEVRALRASVFDEVCAISREALLNAYRHSEAGRIVIEIVYGDLELCVQVRDDGHGITKEESERNGRDGHWGLVGMRERAAKLGAVLSIRAVVPSGTAIEVCVESGKAYQHKVSAWKRFLEGGSSID